MPREMVSEKTRAALKRLTVAFRATAEAKSRTKNETSRTRRTEMSWKSWTEMSRTRTSELSRRRTREVSHISPPGATCRINTRGRVNKPLNQAS